MNFKCTFFLFLILLCANWIGDIRAHMVGSNPYHRIETLDSQGKYRLEWKMDRDLKQITFHVTVQTKGYVGFGIAREGGMSGADIVVGGVHPNGGTYFSDYHVTSGGRNLIVDSEQNWVVENARENETHTILSFSRKFDTCDSNDQPITENRIGLIWAFGEKDDINYHFQNKGQFSVYLLLPDYSPEMTQDPKTGIVHVNQGQYPQAKVWTINSRTEMPRQLTTYWCSIHKAPTLQKKHHMIGLRVTFPNELSRRHVHHILVYKCVPPRGQSARELFGAFASGSGQSCMGIQRSRGFIPVQYCTQLVMTWAVGGRTIFTPPHVGIPFSETRDEYYIFQKHFDNPHRALDVKIDVKMDFVYTANLRVNDGGAVFMGHGVPGFPSSLLIPPSSPNHVIYGICGSGCTSRMFPPEGIKIYGQTSHTHNTGRTVKLQHFRQNKELPWVASDDNFDNQFQQFHPFHKDVHVAPGDMLVSRCTYDNTKTNGSIVGGYATSQEMCLSLFMYYTKMNDYVVCGSQIDSNAVLHETLGVTNATWSEPHVEFIVNEPRSLEGLRISEVSDNHVTWNLAKRQQLQRFHELHPHTETCNRETYASGRNNSGQPDSFNGPTGYPLNAIPYQPPRRLCGRKRASIKG